MKKIIGDIREYLAIRIKYPLKWPQSKIESPIPSTVVINEPVVIKKNVLITAALEKIGSHTYIGNSSSIFECKEIGRFCSISHGAKIGVSNHALDHISTSAFFYSKTEGWIEESTFTQQEENRCVVEDDVLISANAIIANGVKLSVGSVVGAGAFVNKDVPPYAIVAGVPAKIIRYRFDEQTIKTLLESEWWKADIAEILKHKELFRNPVAFVNKLCSNLSK